MVASLPLFERVVAQTWNRAASIMQVGSYAPPTGPGSAFPLDATRVNLRVDDLASAFLHRAAGEGDDGLWLHLVAAGGVAHRVRPLTDLDRYLVAQLDQVDASGRPGAQAGRLLSAGTPVPLQGFEGAPDQLGRLDAALAGTLRPAVGGEGPSRPVDASAVAAVLDHACSIGLPVGIGVVAPSALQACRGILHATQVVEGRLVVALEDALVEIDLAAAKECRVVQAHAAHGPTSAVEVYDEDGRCAAVLTQFGIVGAGVHATWEEVTGSLPSVV